MDSADGRSSSHCCGQSVGEMWCLKLLQSQRVPECCPFLEILI